MLEKIRKLGAGEILLAVIIILGIAGTVSFFFFEEALGEYKTSFIIFSSLAFIGAFFVLSVYARAIKYRHSRQHSIQTHLGNWMAHYGTPNGGMTPGTLAGIALHLYRMDGFLPAGGKPAASGMYSLVNKDGQRELLQCLQETAPVGLRQVVRFYEILRAEKAARGEIWSLSGFSSEAVHWAAKKPIVLVGSEQINDIAKGLFSSRTAR